MSGNASDKVSIITPLFNGESYIGNAIQSVQAQSYANYEHIIVDDGSKDGGPGTVLDAMKRDPRIQLLENRARPGAAGARNTAIAASTGRYLAFLDCDDFWYSEKLERQIDILEQGGIALVHSSYDLVSADGSPLGRTRHAPLRMSYDELTRRNSIGCLTVMIDTAVAGRPLMPDIRMRQDWGLWLKVLRETGTAAMGISAPLGALRIRADSLSRNKWRASYYNYVVLRRAERLSVARSLFCVACHTLGAIRER